MQHAHHHSTGAVEGSGEAGAGGAGFFARLLDTGFVPRAVCFNNDAGVIWLHVASDVVIAAAYFSIPIALVYFVLRRRDLVFHWMFLLFGAFILLCGATHVFGVLAVWRPVYRLDGVVKAFTGVVSIATAIALWPLIPRALSLPSPSALRSANAALEQEVEERRTAQEELQRAREDLEVRVEERTAELNVANRMLEAEVEERRAAEEELVQHRARLEELIRERTVELAASHERLRMSERMASLGTLAAGLGHDMGNLLLPVRTRLDSLRAATEAPGTLPDGAGEDLLAIRKCVEHLQRLAGGLRLFAHDPANDGVAPARTELSHWWSDVAPFLKNVLPRSIALEFTLDPATPAVGVAAHRLTQAVFNLVQNAGEALAGAGAEQGHVQIWARPGRGETVLVGVSDNGPGMSEAVKRRCLEPFYSSKVRGISTGLGLALVHGIVQGSGGAVKIESTVGQGTTFTLELPVSSAPAEAERVRAVVSIGDARVRSFVRDMLSEMGFAVEIAAVMEAVEGLGREGEMGGVWVTDGRGDAVEVARRLLGRCPGAQVLVVGREGEAAWEDGGRGTPAGVRFVSGSGLGGGVFSPARLRDALRSSLRPERPSS